MNTISDPLSYFATGWLFNIQYDLGRYLIAAPAVYLCVHVLFKWWFRNRRIRRDRPAVRDIRREFLWSLLTALIFASVGVSIFAGVASGMMVVEEGFGHRGWVYFVGSVIAAIIAHDAYFYWTHRLMHHRRLFRWSHLTHHRSRTPTPFAAYAFGPVEAMVQAAFLPLLLLVMPMSGWAIFAFLLHMIVRNAIGHSGHEWFPRGTSRGLWLGWLTTVTHHDMHHENVRGNYGLYFTWWDRLMGTEQRGYHQRFDAATGGATSSTVAPAPVEAKP